MGRSLYEALGFEASCSGMVMPCLQTGLQIICWES